MSFPQGFNPMQGIYPDGRAGHQQPVNFFFGFQPRDGQNGQQINLDALFGGRQGGEGGEQINIEQLLPLMAGIFGGIGGNQPLAQLNPEQTRLHELAKSSLNLLRNGPVLSNWQWRPFPTFARLAQDASFYAESKLKTAFTPGLGQNIRGGKVLRAATNLGCKLFRVAVGVIAAVEVAFFFVASLTLFIASRITFHKIQLLKRIHQKLNATYYQGLLQLKNIKDEFTIFWMIPSSISLEATPLEATLPNIIRNVHTALAALAPIYRGEDLFNNNDRSTAITTEFYSLLNVIREGLQRDFNLQLPQMQPINLTPQQINLIADLLVRDNMVRLQLAMSNLPELLNIALAVSQGLGVPVAFDPLNANGPSIKLNGPNEEGQRYREFLLNLIKESAKEEIDQQSEADDILMPKGIYAVLNLSVLKEIRQQNVYCPKDLGIKGSESLNQRRELITEGIEIVSALKNKDNQLAFLKTVLRDDCKNADNLGDDLKRLYVIIGELRNQLERGPLLTETKLSMRGQESRNLFQQAIVDALRQKGEEV